MMGEGKKDNGECWSINTVSAGTSHGGSRGGSSI